MAGLKNVKFESNNLNDEMVPPILFACYMNPDVTAISFHNNFLRGSAAATYYELSKVYPEKLREFSLQNSIHVNDHAEMWTLDMELQLNLQQVNL